MFSQPIRAAQRPTPNAQRPTPNAQRPTPNAQRPTPNALLRTTGNGTAILLGIVCMIAMFQPAAGQLDPRWGLYNYWEPQFGETPLTRILKSGEPFGGIGGFDQAGAIPQLPRRLFHLYSNGEVQTHPAFQPAFLRIQSNQGITPGILRPIFSQTGIEFFAGKIDAVEEQISTIQSCELTLVPNSADQHIFGDRGNPRGLDILTMKPGTNGFLAAGNQVRGLRILTAEILNDATPPVPEWKPRIGIGTDAPREMLQLGERFTFHSQGGDVIGHNIYYDSYDKNTKRIGNAEASSIGFWHGIITLATVGLGAANSQVDMANWPNNTLQGMTIVPIAGNARVGVGLTYPGARLDIKGYGNNGSTSAFRVMNSDQTTLFQIYDHGAVGIGTTTPERKLHVVGDVQVGTKWDEIAASYDRTAHPFLLSVNGAVVAKLVKVTVTNWADNVFSPDYRLMPLSEVKEFIVNNGRLPDVPSEQQVKKEGVDLQEIQGTLLRKVEELTLHLIKLEEENKELRRRVDALGTSTPK